MMNRFGKQPELSRNNAPPQKEGIYWVECLKGKESQKFLIFSPEIQGVDMHWIPEKRRTVPCFTDHALCPGGHSEKTVKWRGYVFAFSYKRHSPVFVQLTKDAVISWNGQNRENVNLRGQTINVHRTEKDNGRLWVEVETWRSADQAKLPGNQDCRLSLYDLWRFDPSTVVAKAEVPIPHDVGRNGHVLH